MTTTESMTTDKSLAIPTELLRQILITLDDISLRLARLDDVYEVLERLSDNVGVAVSSLIDEGGEQLVKLVVDNTDLVTECQESDVPRPSLTRLTAAPPPGRESPLR
jgi:hypothetical protein